VDVRRAKSLADGAESSYEEERDQVDATEHVLRVCWTVPGRRGLSDSPLDEMCMSLNELAEQGAAIEVTFYDARI